METAEAITRTTSMRIALSSARPRRRQRNPLTRRRATTAYLFISPALIFFALFFFYPLGAEFVTSLHTGPRADQFTGFGNYGHALRDPAVRHAFFVTIRYAAAVLVFSISFGLILSLILNQRLHGRVAFRGILLVPYLTSVAIIGLLWRNILDPQVGILNRVLGELGLPQQAWLSSHPLACVVFIAVWQETGYITMLFLAGLQGIPEVYYEAARVDGAAPLQRFRYITLPALAPTTLFVSIIGVISSLQQFALPYIVTNGGPGDATSLYVFQMYQTAFTFRDFGYSSALAYLMLVLVLILSVVQLKVGRRRGAA
jgi:multiple sugar transport system permease protein